MDVSDERNLASQSNLQLTVTLTDWIGLRVSTVYSTHLIK